MVLLVLHFEKENEIVVVTYYEDIKLIESLTILKRLKAKQH